jgi:hypothetical protein
MSGLFCPHALRYDERQGLGETRMALTAQEAFAETVRDLPPSERLRLAALILQDLAQCEVAVVDRSDTWTEQDQHDVTAFSLQHAAELYPEDEELVPTAQTP